MTTRIKLRRDTAANWTASNPILAAGEPGLETDTGNKKYGDGTTHWADLAYNGYATRPAVGYFAFHGPVPNNANTDWWFEGVESDPEGNAYYTGGWKEYNNYTGTAHVVKLDLSGEVQWQKELPWADGYEGDAVSAVYNTATDQLVVVASMYKMDNPERGAAVIKLNANTGAIIGNPTMIRDEVVNDGSGLGQIDPSDIVLTALGDPVVVGHKNGSGTPYALTTASVGESGIIYIDTAVFADKLPKRYSDWWITGTNITNEVQITEVNYYPNQQPTALASTGTGATFTISSDGAGGYVLDSFTGGTGYSIGNKIKVLGTDLGGATPDNDAVVTVLAVDAGVITGVGTTPYGVSTGAAQFAGVSGTNIVSGSNATFSMASWRVGTDGQIQFPNSPETFGCQVYQSGSGYALNDTMYLNPNQYGGLTSATITVTQIGGSGEILNFAFTGTFNTSTLRLQVNDSGIDFATEGSWTAVNYSAEAFVWTQEWARTLGGSAFDKVNAAATDSQGNIYLACKTYDETTPAPWGYGYTRGFLAKLDSNGNNIWFKQFGAEEYFIDNDGVTGVAVDSNDDIIIVEEKLVTKLDSDGTVIWQQLIGNNDPMDMWNTCVEVDSNDNIYINAEYDSAFNGSTSDDFLVIKFDSTGTVLWQRSVGSTSDDRNNWDNGYQTLSVTADRVFIAGSTYQSNDDVGFVASFPADGSGTQTAHIGNFFYNESPTWSINTTTSTVSVVGGLLFTSTQVTVTSETNITSVDTTVTNLVRTIRTGDVDGRIENLYSLSFEDGSVQTTAFVGGINRAEDGDFIYNTNNFYPDLSHTGKMIRWIAENWNDTVQIYIPHNDDVPFPIGAQLHFVKDQGIRGFMFWPWSNVSNNNDITIIPSSPADYMYGNMYNSGEGWSVRHYDWNQVPARVTLTKIDTNRWLLECTSPTHIMDWSW